MPAYTILPSARAFLGASMYHPSAFVPVSFTRSIAPAALKSAMEEVAATYRLSSGACRTVIESGKFCRIEGSQFSGSSRYCALPCTSIRRSCSFALLSAVSLALLSAGTYVYMSNISA